MSGYFDNISRQVSALSKECPPSVDGDIQFLKGLAAIEAPMIKDCELFAGDIETPEDVREAIIGCIALNQTDERRLISLSRQWAIRLRHSLLNQEMPSLFHDIARMRYKMRYGQVFDNPAAAVAARDRFDSERTGHHPWQKNPPTAGNEPLRFRDYNPPKKKA